MEIIEIFNLMITALNRMQITVNQIALTIRGLVYPF